jgi:hypothetical protein
VRPRDDRRRDVPRWIVVTLVDRTIAQLPPRARMTGAEVADLLLDLRLGIEEVECLPWTDDVDVTSLVAAVDAGRAARRRRRSLFRRAVSESTEHGG